MFARFILQTSFNNQENVLVILGIVDYETKQIVSGNFNNDIFAQLSLSDCTIFSIHLQIWIKSNNLPFTTDVIDRSKFDIHLVDLLFEVEQCFRKSIDRFYFSQILKAK